MRVTGIVLLVAGILMLIFTSFNYQTEKRVVDLGPIQVDKKENKQIAWPQYAGGIVSLLGVVLIISSRKKNG